MKSEIQDPSIQGIEDGRLTSLYFKKLNIADLSCAVFSVMGVVLSILAVIIGTHSNLLKYDIDFISDGGFSTTVLSINETESAKVKTVLLWFVVASTFILCIHF